MAQFGRASQRKLNGCDSKLQKLMNEVIKDYDFSVICGHRGEVAQNKAYNEKRSGLKFPHSKHNGYPSRAVDICPYPIDWKDLNRFKTLAELVKLKAHELNIEIIWGGDWTSLIDMPHFELK